MKIEVSIDGQSSYIQTLDKSSALIGASPEADIQIMAKGTSRRHLLLEIEGDNLFVTDLGSKNGTYLFDQKLIPGKKTEWATFIPLRLGDNVLISFLSGDSTQDTYEQPITSSLADYNDFTQAINLNDLRRIKTEDLIKKNQTKEIYSLYGNKKFSPWILYPVALIILFIAFEFAPSSLVEEFDSTSSITPRVKSKPNSLQASIPKDELKPKEILEKALTEMRCTSILEKLLCDNLHGMDKDKFGVVQTGNTLMILVDGTIFIEQAKKLIQEYGHQTTPEEEQKVAAMLYIKSAIPEGINIKDLVEKNLAFGFFTTKESDKPALEFAMTMRGESLSTLKGLLVDGLFENVRSIGPAAFTFSNRYVVIY